MEFKKVSKNEISCFIDETDLTEWDLTMEDLFSNNDKTREFISDIVRQAKEEYNFEAEDVPLAVQISAIGPAQFIFHISKIGKEGSNVPDLKMIEKVLKETLERRFGLELEEKAKKKKGEAKKKKETSEKETGKKKAKKKKEENLCLFFNDFEMLVEFAKRAHKVSGGKSSMMKEVQGKQYCMVMDAASHSEKELETLGWLAGEYEVKNSRKMLTTEYVMEHYSLLLKDEAVEEIATHFDC